MATQVQRTASARRRLIAATRDLVAAQGVGNTSVAAIGERAGMSRGAVNFHFGSKDDLLVAVSKQVTTDWEAQVLGEGTGPIDVPDVEGLLDLLLEAWLGELETEPDRVRIVVMLLFEALGPSPHLHDHFIGLARRVRDRVAAFVQLQQAEGRVSSEVDPAGFAGLFLGILSGIAVGYLLDPETNDLDSLIAEARGALTARLNP